MIQGRSHLSFFVLTLLLMVVPHNDFKFVWFCWFCLFPETKYIKKGLHLNSSTASNPLEVNISSGHSRIHRCRSSHKMLFWILYYLSESWFSSNALIFNQHSPILEAFWIHDWRWSWQLLTFKERTFTQRKLRKYAGKKEKPRFHFQLEHQSREQKRKRIGTG